MSKLKLLWVGDAGCNTGFARVTHSILDRLYEKYDIDITVVGINYDGWPNKRRAYPMFPARRGSDFLGFGRLGPIYKTQEFDSVVLFQDYWNIAEYINNVPNMKGLIAYYPVDAPNMHEGFVRMLAKPVAVATYTRYGAEQTALSMQSYLNEIRSVSHSGGTLQRLTVGNVDLPYYRVKELTNPDNIKVIPHGVDLKQFYPIDQKYARKYFGLDDGFMVLNVNRNQPRKRLDLCIKGFAEFAQHRKDAFLVLHCWGKSPLEWDLKQLARYYGVADKVLLFHEAHPDLTDEELNILYNAADVVVNTSGGEGWGLPAFEAAACRKPLVLTDWSANSEIWKGAALLTPVVSVYHELQGINTAQAVVDTSAFARQLEALTDDWIRSEVAEKCYKVTLRPEYEWDHVADTFYNLIRFAAEKGELKPRSEPL